MRWAIRNARRAVVVGFLIELQRVRGMGYWAETLRPTLFSADDFCGLFHYQVLGMTNMKGFAGISCAL